MLTGIFSPSFSDFWYYFYLDVANFTEFTYSMTMIISYFTLLVGTFLYFKYLLKAEFRHLFKLSILIGFFGGFFSLAQVLRLNLMIGINDVFFVIFTSLVTNTLYYAYSNLPILVLFAKITPKHIEATIFALLTGVSNFSSSVLSP